ncbi:MULTISPECIES: hypothetical protein [Pasteurellaceae]|uniref:hypothetical protein n=1 Tax=Pasteurellaceae TaxID=712 RepID=UPI00094FCDAC
MNEQDLIALLKKPLVRAALRDIIWGTRSANTPTKKSSLQIHEALVEKLRHDSHLFQDVLDDWRENPSSFSPLHKYSYAYHRAALCLYAQLNEHKLGGDH